MDGQTHSLTDALMHHDPPGGDDYNKIDFFDIYGGDGVQPRGGDSVLFFSSCTKPIKARVGLFLRPEKNRCVRRSKSFNEDK